MISLKHISTLSVFNQTKFSADSTDSSYFLGSDQTQIFQGTPDVKYNDLCYIKCSNLQYTHGHLYGSTEVGEAHVSLTQEEYDALSEEEKNNGKIYLIKESTIPDLIDQLPVATTSSKGLMSAEDKKKLDDDNFIGIFTSGNIEDIINSCTSQKQSGYCYINLETTTGSKPSSAGAVFVQFWSFESQTGCVCLYAHKINSNTAYRGYMANNTLVWQTFN